jgi:hypothetical protein
MLLLLLLLQEAPSGLLSMNGMLTAPSAWPAANSSGVLQQHEGAHLVTANKLYIMFAVSAHHCSRCKRTVLHNVNTGCAGMSIFPSIKHCCIRASTWYAPLLA